MKRGKNPADHRADTRGGRWVGIPHAVIKSAAYQHLSLMARAVLVELVLEMNGYNNGRIALSQRQIAARLGNSNFRKISRATAELMEHGLVDVCAEGKWKQRQARQFRLTFVNTTAGSFVPATNDYLNWSAANKSSAAGAAAHMGKSAEGSKILARVAAGRLSARPPKKPRSKGQDAAVSDSALIDKPYTRVKSAPACPSATRTSENPSGAAPSAQIIQLFPPSRSK